MSIWASGPLIGHDRDDMEPDRGVVLSFATGFSNHYPDATDGPERPASLDTASIPSWCVPGRHDDEELAVGPWLRLSLNSWAHDWASGGKTVTGPESADVLLDETAVRALVEDLTWWLNSPKAYPSLQREADK